MAGNIIHLVLARVPDAPAGHQGREPVHRCPNSTGEGKDGTLGARNGIYCGGH